ncbi:MAG: hypothetical protein AAGA73_21805 [Pseudomonadota bacterium]
MNFDHGELPDETADWLRRIAKLACRLLSADFGFSKTANYLDAVSDAAGLRPGRDVEA